MKGNESSNKQTQKIPYHKKNTDYGKSKKPFRTIGCLIVLAIFLYFGFNFMAYFPGFLAYQNRLRRKSIRPFLDKAVLALEDYSQKFPDNSYPSKIDQCEDLVQLVQQAGLEIDRTQSLSLLSECIYNTNDCKDYILIVRVKRNDSYPYILTPNGILDDVVILTRINDTLLMTVVRTLFSLDQALIEKKFKQYIKYYSPNATFNVKNSFHSGAPTNPGTKDLEKITYKNLESRNIALEKFYGQAFIKSRRRTYLWINKKDLYWEVHSNYNEKGLINENRYLIEGFNNFRVFFSKRNMVISNDESHSSIYYLDAAGL